MTYTVGVELEVVGIDTDDAFRALSRAGVPVQSAARLSAVADGWKVTRDGSVRGRGGSCEVVSPVMQSNDLSELAQVMRTLRNAGARVNGTAGMHVHVGAAAFTGASLSRFFLNWHVTHTGTDLLVSRSRRVGGTSYNWASRYGALCHPHARHVDPSDVADALAVGQSTYIGQQVGRYRSFNLASIAKHGTVEIRMHQGSLNATKAAAWVAYILAHADAARAGVAVPDDLAQAMSEAENGGTVPRWDVNLTDGTLAWLRDAGHLATRHADYLAARAEELAGEV